MIGYVTPSEFIDYAGARGYVLVSPVEASLTRALDWLELQPFAGRKTDPEQVLEFPRNGSDVVPDRIKKAQMEAAILIDGGADLLAPPEQSVTQETVVGAVSVSYSDAGTRRTFYPVLMGLIRDYMSGSGHTFGVRRG